MILVGNRVRLTAEFRDSTGAACDPDVVRLEVRHPSGVVTTCAYPGGLTRGGAGVYYASVMIDAAGQWVCSWHSPDEGAELLSQDVIVARNPV